MLLDEQVMVPGCGEAAEAERAAFTAGGCDTKGKSKRHARKDTKAEAKITFISGFSRR
jgi:hypothetical protein